MKNLGLCLVFGMFFVVGCATDDDRSDQPSTSSAQQADTVPWTHPVLNNFDPADPKIWSLDPVDLSNSCGGCFETTEITGHVGSTPICETRSKRACITCVETPYGSHCTLYFQGCPGNPSVGACEAVVVGAWGF